MAENGKRVVLVTGASSGLGNACATYLSKKGYAVYGTSRDPQAAQRKADEFFELIRMDAEDDDSVKLAVDYVLEKEGRIDVLLCNAGMGIAGPVEETPAPEAARQMDVNFLGAARVVTATLPSMRKTGGTILVTGSIAGRAGVPFQAYYSASKFALEGFVESLRMELKPFPVRIAIVEPGDFRTGFTAARSTAAVPEGSPYREAMVRAIGVMEHDEREGSNPIEMARLVYALLGRKRLRVRYTVGPLFERFAAGLKRVIPSRWYEAIMASYYRVGT